MGNYLSRKDFLQDSTKTKDVELSNGTVKVREMSAKLVSDLFASGAFAMSGNQMNMDFGKISFTRIAHGSIVEPNLEKEDLEAMADKSFSDIQRIAEAAINLTDFEGKDLPKDSG